MRDVREGEYSVLFSDEIWLWFLGMFVDLRRKRITRDREKIEKERERKIGIKFL